MIVLLATLAALAAPLDVERSHAHLEAGRPAQARDAAQRALIEDPADWEAAWAYAVALQAEGSEALVLPELDALAVASEPAGVVRDWFRIEQGTAGTEVLKERTGDAADLAAFALAALAIDDGAPAVALAALGTPDDPWEQAVALEALLAMGRDADAATLAKRMIRDHRERPDAWIPLFETKSTSGPLDKARKAALKAADGLVSAAGDPVPVYRARRLFVAAGDTDRTKAAGEVLVRMGEPAPLGRPPWSQAMRKSLARGLAMQAAPAIPEATPEETRDIALRVALALRDLGRVKEAVGVFEAARARADSVELALAHCEQLLRMGKPEPALAVAREAVRMAVEPQPDDIGRLNVRGWKAQLSAAQMLEAASLAALGRPEDALEPAISAALLNPSAEAWELVGMLQLQLGYPEAAFGAFSIARWRGGRVDGGLAESWTGLGEAGEAADAIAAHVAAELGEAPPEITEPDVPRAAVGATAPPWRLDTDRGPVGWDSTQGRVVVIAFFASWCGPCRVELPELARLARAMSTEAVTFAAVSVDERSKDFVRVQSEIDLEGLYVGWDPDLGRSWHVTALPTTWIVDKKGVLRHVHQGYSPGGEKEMEEQVRGLMAEP